MNLNKSLEQLENDYWAEPLIKTNLVVECHRLRKIPIATLSIENMRMLIGQKIGLNFLVPLALDILERDPFVSGAMYKGDLLANLTSVPEAFWFNNPELNNRLVEIANEVSIISDTIDNELLPALSAFNYK